MVHWGIESDFGQMGVISVLHPSYLESRVSVGLYKKFYFLIFFNCYLVIPRPTLGHSREDILTKQMLITTFVQFQPKGHQGPRNEVDP